MLFEVKNLSFSYRVEDREVEVLKNLDLQVSAGDFIGIQGPSGSGKSTLFYILGFLLKPSSGKVLFAEKDITTLSDDELAVIRNRKVGFIFQQFHLLSRTTSLENILLPTRYPSELALPRRDFHARAEALAAELGIRSHLRHFPNQLSGGQQQRVAIARALMNDVDLILADEPTGNLDSRTATQILDLLLELNSRGKTIILITHDPEVAKRCTRVYHLKDGAFTDVVVNRPAPTISKKIQSVSDEVELPKHYTFSVYRQIARSVFPLVKENLLRNRAKSMLTMLGVVIGVAAVLAMVTLGQFTQRKILETYEALGVNKVLIRGYPNWNLKATDSVAVHFKAFDWQRDLSALPRIFPEIQQMSPILETWNSTATAGGVSVSDKVTALGVTAEYLAITNRKVRLGRMISPYHVSGRSPVCLIGFELAERLFPRVNPLSQIVTVSDGRKISFPCQVIGVLAGVTTNQEWSPPNRHILLPYTYFQTIVDSWWSSQIHEVTLKVKSGSDVEETGKKIKAYFQQKYGKSGQFYVDSDSTLIAQMKRFLSIFSLLLTSIALLSLVVGGIGINNMMLVSVTERIKEFGIRKALGATHRSIRVQVLLESITLCLIAGVVGVVLGFAAYELLIYGATRFVPHLKFEWVFEPVAAFLSAISIVAVGVASGFVPAVRAERLQVIEALRSE